ncbi:hypothetical protein [Sulfobacillus thermosulfidooxidans]|uniref:hypothetical protein n=1 Tax=Sulfobacillus thermosulfidooxidans TaxID=28034 RepID=UPI0019D6DEC5|nr:hypothetical protein [Sulfobacillus thermosulfidooxidans]
MSYWMAGLLGMNVLAGCGFKPSPVVSHHTHVSASPSSQFGVSKTHSTHIKSSTSSEMMPHSTLLRLGDLSVRVPNTWKVHSFHQLSLGVRQIVANTGKARLTLTMDPLNRSDVFQLLPTLPKPQGLIKNPWNQSPYFTEAMENIHGELYVTMSDLSLLGSRYAMNMSMPTSESETAQSILASIKAPQPLSVTQGVRLLLAKTRLSHTPSESTWTMGQYRWLLVGGEAATAQEPFFLFRSKDGGRHWNLVNYTRWTASPYQVFPDTVGNPALAFWTTEDGLIAQPSYATPQILLFRTTNGGISWQETRINCPSQPNIGKVPTIILAGHGHITVSVSLSSGKIFQVSSQNNGINWQG